MEIPFAFKVLLATALIGATLLAFWRTCLAGPVPTAGREVQSMRGAEEVASLYNCFIACCILQ